MPPALNRMRTGHNPRNPLNVIDLHPAMATPNLMVVEMLGIEWDPMVKWLVDPPMPDGGYWKPDPERPGNGIELNPHAVAQYKLD